MQNCGGGGGGQTKCIIGNVIIANGTINAACAKYIDKRIIQCFVRITARMATINEKPPAMIEISYHNKKQSYLAFLLRHLLR